MAPGELLPSPQVIVALNWSGESLRLESLNVATMPEKLSPSLALTGSPLALMLVTLAVTEPLAEAPSVSLSVTATEYEPVAKYSCVPSIQYGAPGAIGGTMVPVVVAEPS